MTEAEWLTCTDPMAMLEGMYDKGSDRKMLLVACACCRRLWHLMTDERFREAVAFTEQYVDGRASEGEREAMDLSLGKLHAHQFGSDYTKMTVEGLAAELGVDLLGQTPSVAVWCAMNRMAGLMNRENKRGEAVAYECSVLRDVFGNSFRPVAVDTGWLTPEVVTLARTIYDGRAFDRLPVLADALEVAGCHDADILAHCREPGDHVRGCWVVDLLLGKG